MRPIIGTEAIASGELTRGRLRARYSALHPNVYLANGTVRHLAVNAEAAYLWTGRTGIIAGRAAAALHGVREVTASTPVDLFAEHGRKRAGIVIHEERVSDDEIQTFGAMRVTTPARTALDLARWLPRDEAVILLDRLAAATGVTVAAVEKLAERHRGARGVRGAWQAIHLMDGGTRSPEETRLRLMLRDGGLPAPRTSIRLGDGFDTAVIGMGWESSKVGVSFFSGDGGDRYVAMGDQRHLEVVQRFGWQELRVVAGNVPGSIVHRARRAIRERGG